MGNFGRGVETLLSFAVGIAATAVLKTAVAACFGRRALWRPLEKPGSVPFPSSGGVGRRHESGAEKQKGAEEWTKN